MATRISEYLSLFILFLCTRVDAALPNPIRLGIPPLDYTPWFDCSNGICGNDQLFMPILAQELSHRMNTNFVFTPFTRNFTQATYYQRIYEDLADDMYEIAWAWMTPGYDPYNFRGIRTPLTVSLPYFVGQHWALITKSKADIQLFRFLEPFRWDLWLAIVGCLFLVSAAMVLLQIVDPREGTSGRISFGFVVSTVYHSWAAVLGGEDYEWMTASARILRIALLFLVLITGATYTANLAAFFTKPAYTLTGPKTLAELKGASICLTYTVNANAMMPFSKKVVAPPDTVPYDLNSRVDWCRDQMRKGNAEAILEPDATAQGILLQNCENMASGRDISILPQYYVFALRADNPELLAALTLAITEFIASPAYQSLLNTAFSMGRSCSQEIIDSDAPEIDLAKMRGFFLIFGVIVGLAVMHALLNSFWIRLLGASKKIDDDHAAMTDAEMLVSLRGKVDLILNQLSKVEECKPCATNAQKSDEQGVADLEYSDVVPLT